MKKKTNEIDVANELPAYEDILAGEVSGIIERRKAAIVTQANSEVVLMFWEVGRHINKFILNQTRADYGKRIVEKVSIQLVARYGASYNEKGLRRMIQFGASVDEKEIVATAWRQLSWSHIREILPLKNREERMFYVAEIAERRLGVRDTKRLIARKTYERTGIAKTKLSTKNKEFII